MDIQDFPFLSQDEFTEACHHLENRYRQATLGPVRRRWRLRLLTALDLGASSRPPTSAHSPGHTKYIQIVRPLEETADPGNLSLDLGTFSISDSATAEAAEAAMLSADSDMRDAEEADDAVMGSQRMDLAFGQVTYEIHLHPTYRLPCLWFTLQNLPHGEVAFDIDTVFRRLVPDEYKAGLRRGVGGIGGISADHHPVTGVPAFFVHPCMVGDAISGFECSCQDYLMIWLGLVGGCVGLWVPKEMATP
ncbi:Ubiquitin-like-conjugating enzyme ATG10 [Escovopsis weberi]|uniref:Ubiquitin-like-conjugating enzyme ATG10 n=1 Tax=Escovopsis weberi TaxID=150374 RepID=A0A0M9VRN8_ESCWE|nr:Ubiquitin-like-conjugating enzyme ATG10 [Escovopsis weberi]